MAREKDKKKDILKAAFQVFTQVGFHNSTISSIAEKASVGKGTIYEYFENKDQLFYEMLEYILSEYINIVKEKVGYKKDFKTKLETFVNVHKTLIFQNLDITVYLNTHSYGQSVSSNNRKRIILLFVESRKEIIRIITDILIQGTSEGYIGEMNMEFCSDILYSMVIRMIFRGVIMTEQYDKQNDETGELIELFLNGIKK